jgi:hypothetical protein
LVQGGLGWLRFAEARAEAAQTKQGLGSREGRPGQAKDGVRRGWGTLLQLVEEGLHIPVSEIGLQIRIGLQIAIAGQHILAKPVAAVDAELG